jgi:hypothetical protein
LTFQKNHCQPACNQLFETLHGLNGRIQTYSANITSSSTDNEDTVTLQRPRGLSPITLKMKNGAIAKESLTMHPGTGSIIAIEERVIQKNGLREKHAVSQNYKRHATGSKNIF